MKTFFSQKMYILGFMISFGERGMGFLPAKAMSGVWAGRARTEIPRLTPRKNLCTTHSGK